MTISTLRAYGHQIDQIHAKRELADGAWRERIEPILYRPFDVRTTVFDGNVAVHRRACHAPHASREESGALIMPKQHRDEFGALAAQFISAHKAVATYDINYHFPRIVVGH